MKPGGYSPAFLIMVTNFNLTFLPHGQIRSHQIFPACHRVKKTQDKAICFPSHVAGMADLSKIKAEGNRLELGRLSTAGGEKNLVAKMFGQGWDLVKEGKGRERERRGIFRGTYCI